MNHFTKLTPEQQERLNKLVSDWTSGKIDTDTYNREAERLFWEAKQNERKNEDAG